MNWTSVRAAGRAVIAHEVRAALIQGDAVWKNLCGKSSVKVGDVVLR